MRRTEEEVWKLTPRKLQALLMVHYDLKKREAGIKPKNEPTGFIDQIKGW